MEGTAQGKEELWGWHCLQKIVERCLAEVQPNCKESKEISAISE